MSTAEKIETADAAVNADDGKAGLSFGGLEQSAGFVLRKVPVLWTRLRRGPAKLRAEVTNDGRVLIHYEDFRYCRDPLYRLLSIANCQALVLAATDRLPQAEVIDCTRTTMTLSFRLPA